LEEISLRLANSFPNLDLTLDFEIFKSLCSPFPLPEINVAPCNWTLCFAAREISVYTTFTYPMIAFGVDFETKSRVCTWITATDRAFICS
jgi:hypothetical protein